MTAFNAGRSSQTGESSSASWSSESSSSLERSLDGFDDSGCCRRESDSSDAHGADNSEQTETERLRKQVKELVTELDETLDCYEHALIAVRRQKVLTELRVSAVLANLPGGQYAGYTDGRVIYSWERQQRLCREYDAARRESERRRKEELLRAGQAVQQRYEARLRAAGLDAWIKAPHNPSAKRRLI